MGALHVETRGVLEQTDHAAAAFRFEIPVAPCQTLLDSVPTALLPVVEGMSFSGTFGAEGHVVFDSRSPTISSWPTTFETAAAWPACLRPWNATRLPDWGFVTDEVYQRRLSADRWQYMMGLLDCAKPHTGGITTIDGINGNVFTRMNYAPAEFQNVKFEKICDPPFVKITALKDIAAGEELWVDYGPNYRYDFMNDAAVIKFFADLHAQRAKEGRAAPIK